jgi:hypothetical protein
MKQMDNSTYYLKKYNGSQLQQTVAVVAAARTCCWAPMASQTPLGVQSQML